MEFLYAATPDPEMSARWEDVAWPPAEWYNLPDDAVMKAYDLWDFDDMPGSKQLAARMTQEQVLLWAVLNVAGQVRNGGFSQALYNSYGQLAEESVSGLRLFGLTRYAEIFDEAFSLFGVRPIPRDREARIQHLEKLANSDQPAAEKAADPHSLEGAFSLFSATRARWGELEKEFYGLSQAPTHGEGYNAAFYRPLCDWIFAHRDCFFIL